MCLKVQNKDCKPLNYLMLWVLLTLDIMPDSLGNAMTGLIESVFGVFWLKCQRA